MTTMCIPFTHKWETKSVQKVSKTDSSTNHVVGIWHVYTLVCKKCGDVKSKKVEMEVDDAHR